MQSCIAARALGRFGGPLTPGILMKNNTFECFSIRCQRSIIFHRDPRGQGTPPGLLNARAAKRIRKADINICGKGRAESIGFSQGS